LSFDQFLLPYCIDFHYYGMTKNHKGKTKNRNYYTPLTPSRENYYKIDEVKTKDENKPSIPSKEYCSEKEEVKMNGAIMPSIPSIPSIENNGQPLDTIKYSRGADTQIVSNPENIVGRKKKKGVKLDALSTFRLEQEVQMNMVKHQLAKKFFSARQFWFFTVPQMILSVTCSILAFFVTTGLLKVHTNVIINTIVGSISGAIIVLQIMGVVCDYGTREAMHDSAFIDLRNLRDDLVLLKQKLFLNEERIRSDAGTNDTNGIEDKDDNNEDHDLNFEDIQTRFKQSLSGCKSTVPMEISEAFHGLQSDILLKQSRMGNDTLCDIYEVFHFQEFIELKAYGILSGEITNSVLFPIYLPNSDRVVKATMNRLKKEMVDSGQFTNMMLLSRELFYGCKSIVHVVLTRFRKS